MPTEIQHLDEMPFLPGMGTINASGVIKNLNGSSLSVTEIFLRELVQNSFDARKTFIDKETGKRRKEILDFSMRAFTFTNEQFLNLRKLLSTPTNENSYYKKYVLPHISQDMLNIEVSDLNTTGLCGDFEPSSKTGDQNFTNFVYFTGNDKQKETDSGGSYGFGKAALFMYSHARTIAVYTRIKSSNGYSSRFIVISSDERISNSNSDRCWWGVKTEYKDKSRGNYAAPVLNEEADLIAEELGLQKFETEQTGTRILVLNAGPDEMPVDEYGNIKTIDEIFKEYLPKYIVHWYWNKICFNSIHFSLKYEDEQIEIDDPKEIFPYNMFYKAYYKLLSNKNHLNNKDFEKIESVRPKVTLGYVQIVQSPVMNISSEYKKLFEIFDSSEPIIAFMRGIGHIVYYEKYHFDEATLQSTCYGIFKVDNKSSPNGEEKGSIDRYFRDIENQTHDRWEHREGTHNKFNYLKRVDQAVKEIVQNNCIEEIQEQRAQDISAVIQRVLGEKLMPYHSSIGGAKVPLQKSVELNENQISSQKSTLSQTENIRIDIENSNKIISVEYNAKVKRNKKIIIHDIKVGVRTVDPKDGLVLNNCVICFNEIEMNLKDGTNAKYTKPYIEIKTSQNFWIRCLCKEDCLFDISINWEEKNEQ